MKKNVMVTETIFNIACYNMSRNYGINKKNSKRSEKMALAIFDYIEHIKSKEKKSA